MADEDAARPMTSQQRTNTAQRACRGPSATVPFAWTVPLNLDSPTTSPRALAGAPEPLASRRRESAPAAPAAAASRRRESAPAAPAAATSPLRDGAGPDPPRKRSRSFGECAAGRAADRVSKYELFKVPPRWLFLRLETEQGLVGWGEPNVVGFSDTVAKAVEEMMPSVLGEDPSRIQYLWQKLHRQRYHCLSGGPILMSALGGIDQALWDIAGKSLGVPVHQMLGGAVRQRLRMFRSCGGDDNTPEEAAAEAKAAVSTSNFKLVKVNPCSRMGYVDVDGAVEAAVARMRAVREAVGPNVGIGIGFHGRAKVPAVKNLMKRLEPFDPLFFEEPVCSAQNPALKDLSQCTHVPFAAGERMYTIEEFRDLLEQRSVGIVQPDCSHVGGISCMLAIARLAEAYEVAFAPHCPLGPIALASCLQIDACSANFAFQESSIGLYSNAEGSEDLLDYVVNKEVFHIEEDGHLPMPSGPGLGVVIDEDKVRAAAKLGHDWKDRAWELSDGTPTTR